MSKTFVDIDILQTVPPSNLNRDDTGSPKTALYGGVQRARVSSQAWKKATRDAFAVALPAESLGIRTKKVVETLSREIRAVSPETDAEAAQSLAAEALRAASLKVEAPRGKKGAPEEAGYLVFLSRLQLAGLARVAVAAATAGEKVSAKDAKAALKADNSIDLALFGRMVADDPSLNVDATCQVAHAISVHAVSNEFDYFTAVDDEAPEDNAGAGMIGTVEFNSSTLYRYATVNAGLLEESLGETSATAAAVREFVRAFVTSMPTGKQNTFANRTLPDAVIVSIRSEQPVNLSGAFEEPVEASATASRVREAATSLARYKRSIEEAYGIAPDVAFVVATDVVGTELDGVGERVSLPQLAERVAAVVEERLAAAS